MVAAAERASEPIVICGCPRSGTRLMARIVGGCAGHFLVTEHKDKSLCPEDRSGLRDNVLWWEAFDYRRREGRRRPDLDEPAASPEAIQRLRQRYLEAAAGARLVVKNPSHILHVPVWNRMFPDAFFVYCVRHPLAAMRSISVDRRGKTNLLRTSFVLDQPTDRLLRAAATWAVANDLYLRHRGERWVAVRYEDLVEDGAATLERLFAALRIQDGASLARARQLPERRDSDLLAVRRRIEGSKHRDRILMLLSEGAEQFGYSLDPAAVASPRPAGAG